MGDRVKNNPSPTSWALFAFLVFAIVLLLVYQNNKGNFNFLSQSSVVEQNKDSGLPITSDKPYVQSLYYSYTFNGSVKEVKESENFEVVLDISDPTLPQFVILPGTQLVKLSEGGSQLQAEKSELKVGSRIAITATFEPKTNQWVTRHILIYPN